MSTARPSEVKEQQEDLVAQLLHSFEDEFRTAWFKSEGRTNQAENRSRSEVLLTMAEEALRLTGADGALIGCGGTRSVRCVASAGEAPPMDSQLDSGIVRVCLETGKAVLCEDVETDSRFQPLIGSRPGLRSVIVVPVNNGEGSVVAFVEVLSRRPAAFGSDQIASLEQLAVSVAAIFPMDALSPASTPSADEALPVRPLQSTKSSSPIEQTAPTADEPVWSAKPLTEEGVSLKVWLAGAALLAFLLVLIFGMLRHRAVNATPHRNTSYSPEATGKSPRPSPYSLGEARPSSSASSSASAPAPSSESAQGPTHPGSSVPALRPPSSELELQPMQPSKAPGGSSELGSPRSPPLLSEALRPEALPMLSSSGPAPPVAPLSTPVISPPDFVLDRSFKAHSSWVTSVAFSSNGQRLASGSWDQTLKFWDVTTGRELTSVERGVNEVQALAFSSDGRWLATANSKNTVTLRDAATGQEVRALQGKRPSSVPGSNWIYSIAFSPDGRWLASGVDDRTVRVWDTKAGEIQRDLVGLSRPVMYVAFSPDGRWLATGDGDKSIEIWEVLSGRTAGRLTGHKGVINAVTFSPDGRWLASASSDKTVKIWDVATGKELRTLIGHRDLVTSLAFSGDGHWLASGSWDKTIGIWNLETGSRARTLSGHDPVYTVAFDSSGRWLASGSEDGAIHLWRVDTGGAN
jgi:WD40 repeat protein